ncbi:UDP-N-acetyl-D-glucosamine 6-dehydrogenase like protein [Verticillium longisporum]|uniref:UDP-N-acetyl-D-glucosamine 6-dehydrogenase like protein n=1 Tax=Verticillium longisporum TaxID=100787 RepID=A0A8I2ZT71_VERLO|nr:UDP-N-acetyl-D-glucosamine 6-dehydrogenase like protein [Verticillium longisporum]
MATGPYLDTPELFAAGSSPACQFGVPSDRKLSWVYSTVDEYYPTTPPTELCESDEELCEAASSSVHLDREPLVAVLGVGYVGEHLVSNFARKYDVLGFDVSEARMRHLAETFPSDTRAKFTCRPKDLAHATHFLISVPTLLRPDQTIDSSFLRSAIENIATYARQGSVVVVESSVAVGMTRSLLGTLAKERGFFAGMSPERVDPGRTEPPAHAIPKIVSGLDDVVPGSLNAIIRLYSQVFDKVVPVSRPEVAEMMKFRPSVLVVGIGFKRGQSHLANSPGLDLARSLVLTEKVEVTWVDPLVKQEAVPQIKKLDETSEWNSESLRQRFNMIVVAFRQEELDFQVLEGMEAKGVRVEMWCD